MDNRRHQPDQEAGGHIRDDGQQQAVRHGRVDTGQGKRKTLWQLIKAGLVKVDNPPSKHRTFTRTNRSTVKYRKLRRTKRQVARASQRRNRPPKRRTGVRAVR